MVDLPDGSKFRAFPFKDEPNKNYALEELKNVDSRRSIASELKLDFDRPKETNLKSVFEKAIEVSSNKSSKAGFYILNQFLF